MAVLAVACSTPADAVTPPPPAGCYVATTCVHVFIHSGAFEYGEGTVTSSPAGIDCEFVADDPVEGTACDAFFYSSAASISISLTATPGPGSFASCQGATFQPTACTVRPTLYASDGCTPCDHTESVDFRLVESVLTVTKSGPGTGTVTSQPTVISCGTSCQTKLVYGSKITLTATPDKGAVFQTWTGACNGQGATCTLTVTADTSTNAVFGLAPSQSPPSPPTTTTSQPPPKPQQPPRPPAPKSALAARIVYAVAVRSGKHRLLKIRVRVSEQARAQIRLLRRGFERLEEQTRVRPGGNTITEPVPASLRAGAYQLELVVRDATARQKTYHATVRLPT